ncbi:MAG: hypothetical protein CUN56_00115 [Phototrophicales bacterium]|nr:MAG: hypothetical protein CUN56_00115 [Phototrophicales bacterium]
MSNTTEKIIRLLEEQPYAGYAEIGRDVGVGREYVRRVAVEHGLTHAARKAAQVEATLKRLIQKNLIRFLGSISDEELAKHVGSPVAAVRDLRKRYGLAGTVKLPIGCRICGVNPYADGLCRACYERDRRKSGRVTIRVQVEDEGLSRYFAKLFAIVRLDDETLDMDDAANGIIAALQQEFERAAFEYDGRDHDDILIFVSLD